MTTENEDKKIQRRDGKMQSDLLAVAEWLEREPNLLPSRTNALALHQAHLDGRLVCLKVAGQIVAVAVIWPAAGGLWELGTICTRPDHRGHGYSRLVFNLAMERLRQLGGRGAFLVTYERPIMRLVATAGWASIPAWESPYIPPAAIAGRQFRPLPDGTVPDRYLFFYSAQAEVRSLATAVVQ